MATAYSDVYDAALFNIQDVGLLSLAQDDAESVLYAYMVKAIVDFAPICHTDLAARDNENAEFDGTLSETEIEILALGIAAKWLSHKALFSQNLRDAMSSKDYSFHSPANMLLALKEVASNAEAKFKQAMREYSYNTGDISSLNM